MIGWVLRSGCFIAVSLQMKTGSKIIYPWWCTSYIASPQHWVTYLYLWIPDKVVWWIEKFQLCSLTEQYMIVDSCSSVDSSRSCLLACVGMRSYSLIFTQLLIYMFAVLYLFIKSVSSLVRWYQMDWKNDLMLKLIEGNVLFVGFYWFFNIN